MMHDIWNPWHGCTKVSEGCQNCYMFRQDRLRGRDGSVIYKTKSDFDAPLKRDRLGNYKVKSGEMIRVCMNSDFFLEEADSWRDEAWDIMRIRSDVIFFLLTKRPERVKDCLPEDFGDGWDHIFLNVTCENQRRADERIPILLSLPFRHKGIMCAPYIGPVSIEKYMSEGQIEQVLCDGENDENARPCRFQWIQSLREECVRHQVSFTLIGTGTHFVKDGKHYRISGQRLRREMAFRSGMNYSGKEIGFRLVDALGMEIPKELRYVPTYRESCAVCACRPICNGCSNCSKCDVEKTSIL